MSKTGKGNPPESSDEQGYNKYDNWEDFRRNKLKELGIEVEDAE